MPDELISDERLAEIAAWMHRSDWSECCRALRELQQWRAAAKYLTPEHLEDCALDYATGVNPHTGEVLLSPCTCGYYDLPAWMRGGM